jgi:hypothetical protein
MAPAGAIGHAALLVASCVAFAPKSCGIRADSLSTMTLQAPMEIVSDGGNTDHCQSTGVIQ